MENGVVSHLAISYNCSIVCVSYVHNVCMFHHNTFKSLDFRNVSYSIDAKRKNSCQFDLFIYTPPEQTLAPEHPPEICTPLESGGEKWHKRRSSWMCVLRQRGYHHRWRLVQVDSPIHFQSCFFRRLKIKRQWDRSAEDNDQTKELSGPCHSTSSEIRSSLFGVCTI